jgi:acrylyl-CoA reductase (NADPH)
MPLEPFSALVVDQRDGTQYSEIRTLHEADLPVGDVVVRVRYSSLNYKDGLAVTGTAKVVRSFPMVPGIDLVGEVVESANPVYREGDAVLLTGWGIGERHWGGFTQYTRVRSEWLVPLPAGLSMIHSMALGTAGFTAMLCVQALEQAGLVADAREVLVTGAAGGVGSIAVALLAKAGYNVAAATGRPHEAAYLEALGARRIVDRATLSAPGRPLEAETWAAAIDTVGGDTLAGVIRSLAYHAPVAACGNAGGAQLSVSVFPFILRAVKLIGVESVMVPFAPRQAAWARLARDLAPAVLDSFHQVVPLADLPAYSQAILAGQVRGRVVVDLG